MQAQHIINFNPVDITIILPKQEPIVFPKQQAPITLRTELCPTGSFNGIPISHVRYGAPSLTPEEKEGTIYLVSMLVAQWFATNHPERNDLLGPSFSKMQYENGKPVGTGGLVRHTDQIKLLDRKEESLGNWEGVKFVNLTGVPLIIAQGDTAKFTGSFENSPEISVITNIATEQERAIVQTSETDEEPINEIPVASVQYGEIQNLPEPQVESGKRTIYIVTQLVAQLAATLCPERTDIVCPNFTPGPGHCYRNPVNGRIEGTTGFIRY